MTFMGRGRYRYFFHVGAEAEHAVEAVLRGIPTLELIQPERNKIFIHFII
jgi:hypothetical protein